MLAAIARDAELPLLADEAASLAERLSAGRFFVACVGQFKRGKSTVLNALDGDPVLPTGVTPVTSVVTILRYGAERRGTVFYTAGPNEEIPVEDVPLYVTGEHNHENVKGVAVVEVSSGSAPGTRPLSRRHTRHRVDFRRQQRSDPRVCAAHRCGAVGPRRGSADLR